MIGPIHIIVDAPEYCLFEHDAWWSCMEKGEWASWAQAFGAMLALIITLAQMFSAKRAARHEKSERLKIINRAVSKIETRWADQVYTIFYSLYGIGQASRMVTESSLENALSDINDLARNIDIQNLPDPETVERVLGLSEKITTVLRIYRKYAGQLKSNMDHFSHAQMESFRAEITPYITDVRRILGRE